MSKLKKLIFLILMLVLSVVINTQACYANPVPLPSILISVRNAPSDLELILLPENMYAERFDKAFESYFVFYGRDFKIENHSIKVTTGNRSFELDLNPPKEFADSFFVLDLGRQSITPGKSPFRFIKPVTAVALTLIIEGAVFFLFGYRKKVSWLVFLIVNLLTQGLLNIWLVQFKNPLTYGGRYIPSALGELGVLVAEMTIFLLLVKERGRLRAALYVIAANILSLVAGGYLFTILPI